MIQNLRPIPGRRAYIFDLALPELVVFGVKLVQPDRGDPFVALPRVRMGTAWLRIGALDADFARRLLERVEGEIARAGRSL